MKKLFLLVLALGTFSLATMAQNNDAKQAPVSKEEKERMKAQKEADLVNAFKQLDLTPDQQTQIREIMKNAEAQGKLLKDNASMSDTEKAEKKDAINNDKNEKIKAVMGAEKYQMWKEIRKKQKEAAEAAKDKTLH